MPFSQSYLDFILEQLENVLPAVSARKMFGGVGIYTRGLFFALIADDVLYFYTDDTNRPDYESAGSRHFSKHYYEVPIEILEDVDALQVWVRKAVAAADRKPKKK
jgi:DNA transformation protein and related proteins